MENETISSNVPQHYSSSKEKENFREKKKKSKEKEKKLQAIT